MSNQNILKTLKPHLFLLNQLFEIEQKVIKLEEQNSISRNIDRLKNYFENDALESGIEYQGFSIDGLYYHNPVGEKYNETRLDCDATISGTGHENLKIIEVIKPIIFAKSGNTRMVLQKAVVIVQTEN
jgi:hypothetical protein